MSICPRACHFLSQVHHYYLKNGPGTFKPCPRSIFIIIDMSQVLSFIVPGPSLLHKEWPWDYQTMSQVHILVHQYVPGPILSCPRSMFLIVNMSQGQSFLDPGPSLLLIGWPRDNQTMSQVHISNHWYVPRPILSCPRSIIITRRMAQEQSNPVPGPCF